MIFFAETFGIAVFCADSLMARGLHAIRMERAVKLPVVEIRVTAQELGDTRFRFGMRPLSVGERNRLVFMTGRGMPYGLAGRLRSSKFVRATR